MGLTNEASPTYFTCTLGQAAEFNKVNPHDFNTINEFVDRQAQAYEDHAAVAFPVPSENAPWSSHIFCKRRLGFVSWRLC